MLTDCNSCRSRSFSQNSSSPFTLRHGLLHSIGMLQTEDDFEDQDPGPSKTRSSTKSIRPGFESSRPSSGPPSASPPKRRNSSPPSPAPASSTSAAVPASSASSEPPLPTAASPESSSALTWRRLPARRRQGSSRQMSRSFTATLPKSRLPTTTPSTCTILSRKTWPAARRLTPPFPSRRSLFKRYNDYVATNLGSMPIGTRVVTYAGYADEIPACYQCELALFRDELKLWIKHRAHDPAIERLKLNPSRSYRGPNGWASPRNYF